MTTKVCGFAARIGNRAFGVQSWEQVSKAYRDTIDQLDLGASETPRCEILNLRGEVVAYVSYNGRVWPGRPENWTSEKRPIYDPRP